MTAEFTETKIFARFICFGFSEPQTAPGTKITRLGLSLNASSLDETLYKKIEIKKEKKNKTKPNPPQTTPQLVATSRPPQHGWKQPQKFTLRQRLRPFPFVYPRAPAAPPSPPAAPVPRPGSHLPAAPCRGPAGGSPGRRAGGSAGSEPPSARPGGSRGPAEPPPPALPGPGPLPGGGEPGHGSSSAAGGRLLPGGAGARSGHPPTASPLPSSCWSGGVL